MDEATRLIESGYRCVSNRHRMVARIDRPDWREHMGREHTRGFRGDPQRNLEEGMRWVDLLGAGAADQYRRVFTKDTIEGVDKDVYDRMKGDPRSAQLGADEYRELVPVGGPHG